MNRKDSLANLLATYSVDLVVILLISYSKGIRESDRYLALAVLCTETVRSERAYR
jgi:hypothetical protein